MSPVAELLGALGAVLDRLGVPWYLFGAQAALLHGAGRLTADVDVTANIGSRPVSALITALASAGFTARVDDADAFAGRTRVVPLLHGPSGMPVDIVLAGPGLEASFLQRARRRTLDGVAVPVACPEDVIAMKLLAGRPKDLDDVMGIVAAQEDGLDLELVRATLRLLEEALDRSDLMPLLERLLVQARG